MIEEALLNYGVLGIWTIFNISTILYYRKQSEKSQDRLVQVIENNTRTMAKVYEVVRKCKR